MEEDDTPRMLMMRSLLEKMAADGFGGKKVLKDGRDNKDTPAAALYSYVGTFNQYQL